MQDKKSSLFKKKVIKYVQAEITVSEVKGFNLRSVILDSELQIEELKKRIEENAKLRISSRHERYVIGQLKSQIDRHKGQLKADEANSNPSQKDKDLRYRQEAEAEKARQSRLSREAFVPKDETNWGGEKKSKKISSVSQWSCSQSKRPRQK